MHIVSLKAKLQKQPVINMKEKKKSLFWFICIYIVSITAFAGIAELLKILVVRWLF